MEKQTVIIRNTVIGSGLPKICVPLVAKDSADLERALADLKGVPWDLAEWRVDFYEALDDLEEMRSALQRIRAEAGEKPLLFTFRTALEGGERVISWEQYAALTEWAAGSGLVDLVDVEIGRGSEPVQELIRRIHGRGAYVLASSHDFEKTPETEKMLGTLRNMQSLGADISKLAVMPNCREDVLRLLEVSVSMKERYADRPFVTMAMGGLGTITRVGAGFDGSAITFGTAGRSSAPGQIPASQLAGFLRILSEDVE